MYFLSTNSTDAPQSTKIEITASSVLESETIVPGKVTESAVFVHFSVWTGGKGEGVGRTVGMGLQKEKAFVFIPKLATGATGFCTGDRQLYEADEADEDGVSAPDELDSESMEFA